MADAENLKIGECVSINDMADELDLIFSVGRIVEVDTERQPTEWRVLFHTGRSEWFDAEELDYTPVLSPYAPTLPDQEAR